MQTEIQAAAPTSKGMLWTGRILSALPVLFMLLGAIFTLVKPEAVQKDFSKYGYPEQDLQWIVIVEIACVVLYSIPATSVLGAILLTGYLGGATATHVRIEEAFFMPVVMGVVLWLGIYLRDARVRGLIPLKKNLV
jgi:hypothetical protein